MACIPRGSNEAHLLDSEFGYEVLDAIVQANVDLKRVSIDELNQMVVQISTHRRRKAAAHFIRDSGRRTVEGREESTTTRRGELVNETGSD